MIVVGSLNVDLLVTVDRHPAPGETILGGGGTLSPGGKGANQALAAQLHGAQVAMIGAVGSDANADTATYYLDRAGVDLTRVDHHGTTGLAVITLDDAAENSIIVIPGANATVSAEMVRKYKEDIETTDLLLLQGEIPAEAVEEAIAIAHAAGVRVVVNLAPVIDVDRQLLRLAHPLIVNEHEAELLGGLEEFPNVLVTLGAEGALLNGVIRIPTPKVTPVDTTGAGDAFVGAFCARIIQGDSDEEAARYACEVASDVTTRIGAQASYR